MNVGAFSEAENSYCGIPLLINSAYRQTPKKPPQTFFCVLVLSGTQRMQFPIWSPVTSSIQLMRFPYFVSLHTMTASSGFRAARK